MSLLKTNFKFQIANENENENENENQNENENENEIGNELTSYFFKTCKFVKYQLRVSNSKF